MADWRAYLRWHCVDEAAPLLSAAFVDETFEFHGKVLTGVPEMLAPLEALPGGRQRAVGEPARAALRAKALHARERANGRSSMVKQPRGRARRPHRSARLDERPTHEGGREESSTRSPTRSATRTSGATTPARDRARRRTWATRCAADALRVRAQPGASRQARRSRRVAHDAADGERLLRPARMNEIVFPAGILQPPFFDPRRDDAVNYGAIGAVIGHEMTHGFDDQGSQFDADGQPARLVDRRRPQGTSSARRCMVEQFDAYNPLRGRARQRQADARARTSPTSAALDRPIAFDKVMEGKPGAGSRASRPSSGSFSLTPVVPRAPSPGGAPCSAEHKPALPREVSCHRPAGRPAGIL